MIDDIETLLGGDLEIPSFPLIYAQLNEAINCPNSSLADIARIISTDSGLAARLLRLANSAFYGFPSNIDTINRALVVVGTRELRDLALGTSVLSLFQGIPRNVLDMESFWRHSVACGVAAKILGIFRDETKVERLFVAGLLHDIGQLVICSNLPDKVRDALLRSNSNGELLHDVEKDLMGFDHTEVGGMLMKKWNIIASLEETVLYHHNPTEADAYPVETAIVHMSDIIANAMQLGHSGEHCVPPLNEDAWELIGLSPNSLSSVIQQTERQFGDVVGCILKSENDDEES